MMEKLRSYTILLFSFFAVFWMDENYIHSFPFSKLIVSLFIENINIIFSIWFIIFLAVWIFEKKRITKDN